MKVIRSASDYDFINNNNISIVPTMGNLHDGHLELIKSAKSSNAYVVATIFINPLQFNDKNDYKNYPITIEEDLKALETSGCDLVFLPSSNILENIKTINAPNSANILCGKSRPGHFDGVLTILNKLFQLTNPKTAYFGLKDYQQYILVKDFAAKNFPDLIINGIKTKRDINGLALSSRNIHLKEDQLKIASNIYKELTYISNHYSYANYDDLINQAITNLSALGFNIDYLLIYDASRLNNVTKSSTEILIAIAAYLDGIRLIDNIIKKL